MKILHVSESDNIGGAAVAATRLNGLIQKFGVTSNLLVSRKKSDADVIAPKTFFAKIYAAILPHLILRYNRFKFGTNELTVYKKTSSPFFINSLQRIEFDLLNLHWVNNGFVGLEDLGKLEKPIVWTLHDTWLFTAGCHSTQGCAEFLVECNNCPKLASSKFQSALHKQFREKLSDLAILNTRISLVVPSRWMLESVKSSTLMKNYKVTLIPNFIDTDLFIPQDKYEALTHFNLDHDSKYIVFGASDPVNDSNKGFSYIVEMAKAGALDGFILLIFGRVPNPDLIKLNIPFIVLNQVNSQSSLSYLYNAAEILIMPSIHESFGQVAAEAMSCGTPVLCFATTGLKDVVDHKINGYLANLRDTTDLIEGFKWIISKSDLGISARDKIIRDFSKDVIFNKYSTLYGDLLNKKYDA